MSSVYHRPLFSKAASAAASTALALCLSTGASAQDRELGAGGVLLDGVAAVVDEGVVLKSELAERLNLVMQNLQKQQAEAPPEQRRPLPPMSAIEQQVLEQLILREIQIQRANKVGITVSDDLLNEALSRVAQNLGYTLEELPTVLASQNIDYAAYRDDSRRDLLVEQLEQRDVISRIAITPREMEQCLLTSDASAADTFDYNISHILISVPANATQQDIEAARKRINEIHDRLENGEDFARLAVATSQAQTALEGGSLGWRKGAQLPTLFAPYVTKMKPGDYSEPIQNSGGFQIVRLNEMRGAERTMVDQLHVRHILLRPNEILDESATQQKLLGIRAQIENGDDFATVAEAVSNDTQSANQGGDLGWVSPGETVPEFEQALAELPLNELSQPIKSRFGWHLVQVLERRSHDTTDEVKREQCARQIRATKAEEESELWARRLRDQAFVDIRR
ncbi:MAG TPA: peptidylprolyl isomerase [Gammaproteobacteria bacterium]|nr:peptidylprolyl isomerase [Gammaproteobacteria bacterium]